MSSSLKSMPRRYTDFRPLSVLNAASLGTAGEAVLQGREGMPTDPSIIDCDIHNVVPSIDALLPFLSEHWREYIRQSAFKGAPDDAYPPQMPTSARPDARSASGAPGSSLDALRAQVAEALPL